MLFLSSWTVHGIEQKHEAVNNYDNVVMYKSRAAEYDITATPCLNVNAEYNVLQSSFFFVLPNEVTILKIAAVCVD